MTHELSTAQKTGVFFATVVTMPFILASRLFALSVLWGWFIVPLGIPPIGMAHVFGLLVLWMTVTPPEPDAKETELTTDEQLKAVGSRIGTRLVRPWVGLGLGWLAHYAMQ